MRIRRGMRVRLEDILGTGVVLVKASGRNVGWVLNKSKTKFIPKAAGSTNYAVHASKVTAKITANFKGLIVVD